MIEKLKNLVWLAVVVFSICGFIQTMMSLSPRVTDVEARIGECESRATKIENRVSGIEVKLDLVLRNQKEQGLDVKDIYHLIMERHSK